MSETNRIEHKRELTKDLDIEKEVIAFLNYHEGGVIYIGIDKDGLIAGVENALHFQIISFGWFFQSEVVKQVVKQVVKPNN
jgi:predicted HTH transcriptional regulator